jgi:hypothetical protein
MAPDRKHIFDYAFMVCIKAGCFRNLDPQHPKAYSRIPDTQNVCKCGVLGIMQRCNKMLIVLIYHSMYFVLSFMHKIDVVFVAPFGKCAER